MRTAYALYDAPMPALAALRALARAGFAPQDVALASALPPEGAGALAADRLLPRDLGPEPWGHAADEPRDDEATLARALEGRGLAPAEAAACAALVAHGGAHLVVCCCPTLAAPAAREALEAALPVTAEALAARRSARSAATT